MRYAGQRIEAPQLYATVEGGQLKLLSAPRVGGGVWAINLDDTFIEGSQVKLDEQLLIEGFDLPAGSTLYGRKLYLRNTTPVVMPLEFIAQVITPAQVIEQLAPTKKAAAAK